MYVETNVRIENGGFMRADRLPENAAIIVGDRVATLRDAEFVTVGRTEMVKLTLRFFGSYGDEYDGDDEQSLIVDRDKLFSRLEVAAC